jgi:beta-fructofuranosidase
MDWFYRERRYKQEAEFELKPNESLHLHIFLDRSVMEVFVNKRLCLTHRIYPTRDDSKAIVLFSKAGTIKVPVLNAWKMNPSNPW